MYSLLSPLYTHIDFGFGATGDAFKEAADKLAATLSERGSLFNEQLPINYLRRHAIELFLKSAIVIIHRCLQLPYGQKPYSGEPYALVSGNWVPFTRLHSVKALWAYLKGLFHEQKRFFEGIQTVDWSFPKELDEWVDEIDLRDPRSTFFRYPSPLDTEVDKAKSVMAEYTPHDIENKLAINENEPKQFIILMENQYGDITDGYYYAGDPLLSFYQSLEKCANMFYGTHAALRSQVCGGAS